MTNQASMRHLALIAILTLASGSFLATASQAAVKSSGSNQWQAAWMLPSTTTSDGCGSDGDPDNPTVDRPETVGKRASSGAKVVEQPQLGFGDGGGAGLWWSRLLQLIGIR